MEISNWLDNLGMLNKILLSLDFALLTAIGAFVRVYTPFTPVPFTLQTAFVLSSGIYLGRKWGIVSMSMYVLLGILGLPIFAGGHGLHYLSGYTGGYLLGFIGAPYITSRISENMNRTTSGCYIASLAGTFFILLGGTLWIYILTGDFLKAIFIGFLPFVIWDSLKALVPTFLAKSLLVRRRE